MPKSTRLKPLQQLTDAQLDAGLLRWLHGKRGRDRGKAGYVGERGGG